MSVERVGLNSAFLFAGRAAEKVAQFSMLILVARTVSIETYGVYSLAIYFTALCTILIDWGIQPYTVREVAGNGGRASLFFRHGIVLKLAYAASALLLVLAVLFFLQYPAPVWRAILIIFASRALLSFAQFNAALFRAHGKMHCEAAVAVVGVVVLLGTTLAVMKLHYGVLGLAVAWLLYGAAELAMSSYLIARILPDGSSSSSLAAPFLREMSKQSLVFGLCSACTLVYFYLDTVILSKMATLDTVSRYTAAYNVVLAVVLVPQVLVDALFPFLSRRYLGEGRSIRNVVSTIARYFLLIVFPLGLGGTLLATPLIRFVYGDRYFNGTYGADRALAILIWDGCLIFFTYLFGQVLAVLGKQSRVTLIAATGALLNIALNFILIPRFSLIGAAIATVTTEFVILLLLGWSLRSYSLFEKGSLRWAEAALGTLCMGGLLWVLGPRVPFVASLASGIGLYSLALFVTGALQQSDYLFLKRQLFP